MSQTENGLLDGKRRLHFIGIGGSGMFPLVQILHAKGYEITGSDVNEGNIIDRERKIPWEIKNRENRSIRNSTNL